MKVLDQLLAGNPINAALNLANTAGMITLKLLPSDEIRKILIDLRKAKIIARSNRAASKAQKQEKLDRIRLIEIALKVARKHKLDLTEIRADLQRELNSAGD